MPNIFYSLHLPNAPFIIGKYPPTFQLKPLFLTQKTTIREGGTRAQIPKSAYPNAYPFVSFRYSLHTQTHTQTHTQATFLTFKRLKCPQNSRKQGIHTKKCLSIV